MCLFLFYDVWDWVPQILKARIGETGPLLFKLPQLLFQLFHRLVGAPFPSYALVTRTEGVLMRPVSTLDSPLMKKEEEGNVSLPRFLLRYTPVVGKSVE
jgi:hypothetical protein